jgi:dTDP-4-dehydrorhamnose reductase
MKIYILGINGMLGSQLFFEFNNTFKYNIRGSTRKKSIKVFNKFKNIDYNVSAYNLKKIKQKIKKFRPDYVINCIGFVKQRINHLTKFSDVLYINSIFPKKILEITKSLKIKLVHFSSDCVFDGKKGYYDEKSIPNARDLYGFSKYLGEVNCKDALEFRTSIIGHEINSRQGILEWFLSQKKNCKGFKNSFFSGLSTHEIFNFLNNYLFKNSYKNIYGLYNLSANKISKYDLLNKINNIYKKNIHIQKKYDYKINRTLNSDLIRKKLNYIPPTWKKMLKEMYLNRIVT